MAITALAPRGGLAEQLAGASRVLVLRNAEIERFEDHHRGIFTIWDGFYSRGTKPSAGEVRDLVALGLVGGGMTDKEADTLVAGLGPDFSLQLYQIAQALVGVAFAPDALDETEADDPGDAGQDAGKKTGPEPGA